MDLLSGTPDSFDIIAPVPWGGTAPLLIGASVVDRTCAFALALDTSLVLHRSVGRLRCRWLMLIKVMMGIQESESESEASEERKGEELPVFTRADGVAALGAILSFPPFRGLHTLCGEESYV